MKTFVWLDEQERIQKKTFTKWVNIYLSLHEQSYNIKDLFQDLKDGTKLIALLEVLSGQTLVSEKKRIFSIIDVFFYCSLWKKVIHEYIL